MNIPPFMSILTDPFELIDVKDKSRPAPRHCSDPVTQTWSLAFHLCLSSLWRTDWSVACKADKSASSVYFLIIYHLDLLPRACYLVHKRGILLHFSSACSPSSVWAGGLDRLWAVWPGASVCWGKLQNGTQEEIRNMRSPRCLCCWKWFEITFSFWPCVDFRQTRKHAWRHAGRLRNEFCVLSGLQF